ncbi:MAG: hypothetical protein AAGC96_04950 [Pseudomonadota bacterium]
MASVEGQRIIFFEHQQPADTDSGIRHLAEQGYGIETLRTDLGEPLPELGDDVAGVIISGGPQFVTDLERFPYLRDEMAFADQVMAKGIPLLGICLGAQLIARHLGARVAYHPQGHVALGYYPLRVTKSGLDLMPDGMMTLSGNAQGFDCPESAELLARGDVFAQQAFRYGQKTVALQFHPEVTDRILADWKVTLGDNAEKPGAQSLEELDAGFLQHNSKLADWYRQFLDRFFGSVVH